MIKMVLFQNVAAKLLTILFLGSILVSIATGHQCYICGSFGLIGNGKPNRNSSESCSKFSPNNSKFIQDCGMDSKGCSIITNGSIVIRACEKYAIEDCKMANNVEYCYCAAELCNKFLPAFIDDEDLTDNEGSGDKIVKTTLVNIKFATEEQTSTTIKIDPNSTEKSVITTKTIAATKANNITSLKSKIPDSGVTNFRSNTSKYQKTILLLFIIYFLNY